MLQFLAQVLELELEYIHDLGFERAALVWAALTQRLFDLVPQLLDHVLLINFYEAGHLAHLSLQFYDPLLGWRVDLLHPLVEPILQL